MKKAKNINQDILDFSQRLVGSDDFNNALTLYSEARIIKYQLNHFSNYFGIIVIDTYEKTTDKFMRNFLLDKLKEMRYDLDYSIKTINFRISNSRSNAISDSANELKNVVRAYCDLIDRVISEYK